MSERAIGKLIVWLETKAKVGTGVGEVLFEARRLALEEAKERSQKENVHAACTGAESEQAKEKPCKIPLGRGLFALVDAEDYDRVKDSVWHVASIKKPYPARSIIKDGKRAIEFLHRVILSAPNGVFVDHRDMDKLDNRNSNLRLCTEVQNRWNKKQSIGTSAFKGVYKHRSRWRATISANGVKHNIGTFPTEIEAAVAYNNKAKELHGDFAWLNKIDGRIL